MKLCDLNPFMRYAELQPSVMSSAPLSCSYDFRLFYIIEGTAKLVLEDKTVDLSAGSLIYFPPETPYYFDGKVKVIVLNFDMTRNHSSQKKPLPPSRNIETFNSELIVENDAPNELNGLIVIDRAFEMKHKMQECLIHYCYPTPVSDALSSAVIKDILCHIAQSASAKQPEVPEIVEKIILYIQQNYDKDITNSNISTKFGYHSFYLNRIFKKSTGVTIHQAVINERIRIAKHLLKETSLSVVSIATESGFPDRSQFCTVFKKHTGYTPSEYRRKKASL